MKFALLILFALYLSACSSGKSPRVIAEELCECSAKANALPTSDPNRSNAQYDCISRQNEEWNKLKNNSEKAKEFNDALAKCGEEQIRKTLGQ